MGLYHGQKNRIPKFGSAKINEYFILNAAPEVVPIASLKESNSTEREALKIPAPYGVVVVEQSSRYIVQGRKYFRNAIAMGATSISAIFVDKEENITGYSGTLQGKFLLPPFSVLNATQDYWKNRRAEWDSVGFQGGKGRGSNLLHISKQALLDFPPRESLGTFDPVLCEWAYRSFCVPRGVILDPFSGGSTRGIVAAILGYKYHGVDLRPEQIEENQKQAQALKINPHWYVGDSRHFTKLVGKRTRGDFIFSSPPYFWREHYSDREEDLNNSKSYEDFLVGYFAAIKEAVSLLSDDRFACFEVAETRDPKTGYAPNFVGDTIVGFQLAGMHLYNHAIHVKASGSACMRAGPVFSASRKLTPIHENVLIFVKGDSRKAVEALGEVEFQKTLI